MKHVRSEVGEFIGSESTKRIFGYKETEDDEKKAYQAILHYNTYCRNEILKKLDNWNYFKYHTFERAEMIFTFLGIGGSLFAFNKLSKSSIKYAKQLKEKASK